MNYDSNEKNPDNFIPDSHVRTLEKVPITFIKKFSDYRFQSQLTLTIVLNDKQVLKEKK